MSWSFFNYVTMTPTSSFKQNDEVGLENDEVEAYNTIKSLYIK